MRPPHPSAVPLEMIAEATERRLAGDWRGACAAANFDVDIDLAAVRRERGASVVDVVEADLYHLVPDLLRWSFGGVDCGLRLTEHLRIDGPVGHTGRRMRLALTDPAMPSGRRGPRIARFLWDSRCTAQLLAQCGGADRLPFFTRDGERLAEAGTVAERAIALDDAGRHADAWTAAGLAVDVQLHDQDRWGDDVWYWHETSAEDMARGAALAGYRPPHTMVHTVIRQHLAANDRRAERVRFGRGRGILVIDLDRPRARLVPRPGSSPVNARLIHEMAEFGAPLVAFPRLPVRLLRLPVMFESLPLGGIMPDDLHPMFHAVLFPGRDGPRPRSRAPLSLTMRIECRGEAHEVRMVDGRTVTPHTGEELARERVLAGLGAERIGCLAVLDGWAEPFDGMPFPLRRLRERFAEMIDHGDRWGVEEELRRGLDPGFRDADGRTLDQLMPGRKGR